ncbi:alpha/beta hydrolase family protein [Tundrisphaera lichenicola]|uniref:alpha/beta hydrolase family protein n=1 Tax=Tundrisphaera lichenicola TaxID=2029860 RepID=UPI003EB6E5BC
MLRRLTPTLLTLAILTPSMARAQTVPGTAPWMDRGEPSSVMVEGLHRFADREIAASFGRRKDRWSVDASSPEAYARSVEPNRERLTRIIAADNPRVAPTLSYVSSPDSPARVAEGSGVSIYAVRWGVVEGVEAEGLLIEPGGEVRASMVAVPDGSSSPEALAGLAPGAGSGLALRLARQGCRVLIPTLLDRTDEFSGNPAVRMTNLPHREWLYRMAYEAGRHPIGDEVDTVRSAVDWLVRPGVPRMPVGVVGHGEGGRIALFASAVDPRIDAAWVAGAFGPQENLWSGPIDRNVWTLLNEFGDAETAALVAPRALVVEASDAPGYDGPPPARGSRADAASGKLTPIHPEDARREFERIGSIVPEKLRETMTFTTTDGEPGGGLEPFLKALGIEPRATTAEVPDLRDLRPHFDPRGRMKRILGQWVAYTQGLIRTSELRRYAYWSKADMTSPEAYAKSLAPYRKAFHEDLIGKLEVPEGPIAARSVKLYDEPKWIGYGVELEVLPDVVASGILLLPRDLKEGERRPVVVCQHGLEGRPEDVVDPKIKSVYNAYGAQLADRGYIVYAPQNPYIGKDRFRTLQRKLNPIGQSLFSVIVAQHDQTTRWLAGLPMVDPGRIAFYGLSYGGKTAMRVPAILDRYCLSICSGDFNEWVVKNTNLDRSLSYMFTIEYDMYEFALAERFNYAEMAALIAPRPFQVERGHSDGVAPDEWIGYEFAKVKRLYDTLGLADRVDIAYFNGGHKVEGSGTFPFLARHLNWPRGNVQP